MALLRRESLTTDVPVCGCGVMLKAAPIGRRRFLGLAGATLAAAAALPGLAAAAEGKGYEAMLLTCIDPRYLEAARRYMAARHWIGKYSQFSFAGAAVGAVADKFDSWHQTFWDNLGITIELHGITTVVALDHHDCGAARLAYGKDSIATPEAEKQTHRKVFAEFRREVAERHPRLQVVTGLIVRGGETEVFA